MVRECVWNQELAKVGACVTDGCYGHTNSPRRPSHLFGSTDRRPLPRTRLHQDHPSSPPHSGERRQRGASRQHRGGRPPQRVLSLRDRRRREDNDHLAHLGNATPTRYSSWIAPPGGTEPLVLGRTLPTRKCRSGTCSSASRRYFMQSSISQRSARCELFEMERVPAGRCPSHAIHPDEYSRVRGGARCQQTPARRAAPTPRPLL
jgi:hypothetical protein